ncbi:MAG: polyisoprenoid-binding protein [Alphaproteobacteria bacterium]|nr:polyisoprenoid-binding protein [Alphaproteobacteria bacterium]
MKSVSSHLILLCLVAGVFGSGASPTSSKWTVDYAKSTLGFSAIEAGKSFQGKFKRFDASISFDPANLADASIDVSVDMNSAETGDMQRDIALPEDDWFAAKKYPAARFVSRNIVKVGEKYIAHGALTIRDTTKPLDLPFSLEIHENKAHAVGEVRLLRTDFGVGQGGFSDDEWVGYDVIVTIDITASR